MSNDTINKEKLREVVEGLRLICDKEITFIEEESREGLKSAARELVRNLELHLERR